MPRRLMVMAGLAIAGMAALPAAADVAAGGPNAITPDAALGRIMAGNARYSANASLNMDYSAGRIERTKAQYPIAAVVSCSDSRVVPELAFDQGPGQLFAVRVAGNFVNGDGLASLEYGVRFLNVPLIVVLGHSHCGAISAAIKVVQEGVTLPGHLANLVQDLTPSVRAALATKPRDLLAAATRENVRRNVVQLRSDQPILADQVAKGALKVVGGVYNIATGKIDLI